MYRPAGRATNSTNDTRICAVNAGEPLASWTRYAAAKHARRNQEVTSVMSDAVSAMRPRSVFSRSRSDSASAMTGKDESDSRTASSVSRLVPLRSSGRWDRQRDGERHHGAAARAAEEDEVGLHAHGEEEEDERDEGDALEDVGAAVGEERAPDGGAAADHGGAQEDARQHVRDEAGLAQAPEQQLRRGGEGEDEGHLRQQQRQREAQRLVAQEHALRVHQVVVVARRGHRLHGRRHVANE
jgi:hypothetical protein